MFAFGLHDCYLTAHHPQTMEKVSVFKTIFYRSHDVITIPEDILKVLGGFFILFLSFSVFKFFFSVLVSAPALLPSLSLMLESILQADQQLMERTKAKLFSALISALHIQGLNGELVSERVRVVKKKKLQLWITRYLCLYSILIIGYLLRRRDYPAASAATVCM